MTDSPEMKSQRRSLWIGVALVLSLAVNTFVLGSYVGGRVHSVGWGEGFHESFGPGGHMGPEDRASNFPFPGEFDPRMLARMLPEEARGEAISILRTRGPAIRALLDASGEARFEAFSHIHDEDFDVAVMTEALAASRAVDQELAQEIHATMIEIMASLTPEQRALMEARMGERFHDRRGRRERFERRHRDRREDSSYP